MYVFVTYARKDMKGVQVRGFRVAKHFIKNEVFFINGGNNDWLRKEGYKYKNISEFNSVAFPSDVDFPKGTKAVIFCDIPTNRLYQVPILLAAQEKRIPVVVLDNIYRRGQTKEGIWKNVADYADIMILNGLSMFKKEESKKIKIAPPLIEEKSIIKNARELINIKYGIDPKSTLLFCLGYNPTVRTLMKKVAKEIQKMKTDVTVFISSAAPKIIKQKNLILSPFLSDGEYYEMLSGADIIVCKLGYLQMIEALIYKKPLIAIADKWGFEKWLDKKLQKVIKVYGREDIKLLTGKVYNLSTNKKEMKSLRKKIASIHDGSIHGGKIMADYIKKISYKSKKNPRNLLLALDTEEDLKKMKKCIRKYKYILPIIISMPFFTCKKESNLSDFEAAPKSEMMDYTFVLIYRFSNWFVNSMSQIYPWYNTIVDELKNKIDDCDRVIITSQKTKEVLNPLLKGVNKSKIIVL